MKTLLNIEGKIINDLESGKIDFLKLPEKYRLNKNIAIHAIKSGKCKYSKLNESLKIDRDIFIIAVAMNNNIFTHESPISFRDDKDIILAFLSCKNENNYSSRLRLISERLKDDDDIAIKAVYYHATAVEYLSTRIKDSYDFAKICVKKSGFSFRFLSERLRDDDGMVNEALSHGIFIKQFPQISLRIRSDFKFVKKWITKPGGFQYFNDCEPKLRVNIDLLTIVFEKNALYLAEAFSKYYGSNMKSVHKFLEILKTKDDLFFLEALKNIDMNDSSVSVINSNSSHTKDVYFIRKYLPEKKYREVEWFLNKLPDNLLTIPVNNEFLKIKMNEEIFKRKVLGMQLGSKKTTKKIRIF